MVQKNNSAFTLIELLIVISVIGILSGVTLRVINPAELNKKSRDSQRVVDIKKIQTALELYYVDFRRYPDISTNIDITGSDELSNALIQGGYIDTLPSDPINIPYQYQPNGASGYKIVSLAEFETINNCDNNPYEEKYGCNEYKNPF